MNRPVDMCRPLLPVLFVWIVSLGVSHTFPAQAAHRLSWEDREEEGFLFSSMDDAFDREEVQGSHSTRLPAHSSHLTRQPVWFGFSLFAHTRQEGMKQCGGMLLAQFPLGALAQRIHPEVSDMSSDAEEPLPEPLPTFTKPSLTARAPEDAGSPLSSPLRFPITPEIARKAVLAAWKTVSLGGEDTDLEQMAHRARWSALLPEARTRVMRTQGINARVDLIADTQRFYDRSQAGLWLEARLIWRFDRLLYAADEVKVERLRAARVGERSKLAKKVVDLLLRWQRIWWQVQTGPRHGLDHQEAVAHLWEAALQIDALTAGWFSAWVATDPALQIVPTPPVTRPDSP